MNSVIENESVLPPEFMVTTRQKILLKSYQPQVQEYALEYPQSPIVNVFLAIGNIIDGWLSSFNK